MVGCRRFRTVVTSHVDGFQPVGLRQQRPEEQLRELGVHTKLLGPRGAAGEHLTDPRRLEDLRLRLTFEGGNVLAQTEPPGQHAQEITIALVDLDSELGEVGHGAESGAPGGGFGEPNRIRPRTCGCATVRA